MPTYEYVCDACGHAFEKFHSIMAAPIKKCPVCGKNKVRRLIGTGAGLIFKGSGFYITDYRDQGYKDKATADASASKGETKSDTKPETTAAASNGDAKPAAKDNGNAPAADAKPAAKAETPAPARSESKPADKSSGSKKKK